ncbi:BMC domain-containing protein [Streptococcus merionis]|uniref:Truncated carbon dioxide concentrating mechanism protein ccmK-like protein n=1 Tax=Streptococcus merionis TaxID=400065 RepID=A0A239T0C7_9STRE|nr:BMC domain-containing protein [Streptococcus merionis]SNU90959.1 truncated carbon dioxide concentrating mechanism protein ccmK-like protein [Streptococcus merionis]
MKALGMIETFGLIGAIEAADVMLKVADVSLLGAEKVRGGLVMISVEGDVGAVKTAVEAGASAVRRLNERSLQGSHVIPRPDYQLQSIYDAKDISANSDVTNLTKDECFEQQELSTETVGKASFEEDLAHSFEESVELITEGSGKGEEAAKEVTDSIHQVSLEEYERGLRKTKAADLRALVSENPKIHISEEELERLVRREMIALLVEAFQG